LAITGTTRLFGVIGHPVAHSLSPAMHNAAFAALGLDMAYVPLPVQPEDVGAAVRGLAALGFGGASVTIPHKGAVIPHLERLDDDARLAEAVNTIVVRGDGLHGYNTDIGGLRAAIEEVHPGSLEGEPALVLGAGGAGRAAALALARMGAAVTVVNRTAAAAERLAALLAAASARPAAARWLPLPELTGALVERQRVVVNATSLGMDGASKVPAALADTVTAGQVVVDVVYTRGQTDFLAQARARGAEVVDGLGMLVHQGAAAFELWTGRPAPLEVMRDAIEGR
jgi:shikimate dehydrogenase